MWPFFLWEFFNRIDPERNFWDRESKAFIGLLTKVNLSQLGWVNSLNDC